MLLFAVRRKGAEGNKTHSSTTCTPLRRSPDGAQSPRFFGQMRELFGAARDITRIFPHCWSSLA